VGASTGTTPSTIAQMARDAIAFIEALELGAVDLLGFSIGSFDPDGYLGVFFTRSATSRQAGVETQERLSARRDDRDKLTSWQTRQAQYDAVCDWGIPDHGQLQRVSAIDMPVFVANGDGDR
jgi:hypothetical protein